MHATADDRADSKRRNVTDRACGKASIRISMEREDKFERSPTSNKFSGETKMKELKSSSASLSRLGWNSIPAHSGSKDTRRSADATPEYYAKPRLRKFDSRLFIAIDLPKYFKKIPRD
ncbi:hypothetical protein EVAR_76720_1 [Eumeta japonica]|uniref:Uncharacterized protein n=1 Tax=Eumeta variegata TaxID=151549 RepID=A0A4C1STL8_EUMVA|nr:hypothetical protein EVAR_76720_1 [Eumeta japonica]